MRIVLDTNVLISGLLTPKGFPSSVLTLLMLDKLHLLIDNRIFLEYKEVLQRRKFVFAPGVISSILSFIITDSTFLLSEPLAVELPDSDDLPFYEVLISAKADYLITGNKKHFPDHPCIVTPKEFLSLYLKQSPLLH